MLNFCLSIILRVQDTSGPLQFYITILALMGLAAFIWIAIFRWDNFLLLMLTIKPFIDITVDAPMLGMGENEFNALEISGSLIFIIVLLKYVRKRNKVNIYNHAFIWLFILIQVISFTFAIMNGEQTVLGVIKFFLRLLSGYFIYFIAAEAMSSKEQQLKLFRNIWYSLLIVSVITIATFLTGISNAEISRDVLRYNGFYNDAGTPSYLSVVCLVFAQLYKELIKKRFTLLQKIFYYISWTTTIIILAFTLTRSALLTFMIFILMWYGIFKRKMILIIPAIIVGTVISFSVSESLNNRFADEMNFVKSDYDRDAAQSMGSGRMARWEYLLDMFNNQFDFPTKLIGTASPYNAHNQYIAYLLQSGIIGLSVFLIIVSRFMRRMIEIYQLRRSPEMFTGLTILCIFLTLSFFGHPFYWTTLLWYLMIMLGLINAYAEEKRKALFERKTQWYKSQTQKQPAQLV